MNDDVTHFCGKLIDEMSREELIKALKSAGKLYNDLLNKNIDRQKEKLL